MIPVGAEGCSGVDAVGFDLEDVEGLMFWQIALKFCLVNERLSFGRMARRAWRSSLDKIESMVADESTTDFNDRQRELSVRKCSA